MRIAIDALGLPRVGGAKTSALGWITALSKFSPQNSYDVYLSRPEEELYPLDNVNQRIVYIRNRFAIRVWAQLFLPFCVKRDKIDLLHGVKNLGILTSACPTIVTINDLTHLKLAYLYPKIDYFFWKYIQSLILKQTNRVIAISKATKADLIQFYQIPEEKITVIHPSCNKQFHWMVGDETKEQILNRYHISPNFLLYVGGLGKHKNVKTLLLAFANVAQKIPNNLVIVGGKEHTTSDNRIKKMVMDLGLNNRVIFLENLLLRELTILYQASKLFVFVSLNEGFGIANLEAMASGTPILTTRSGSIPEIVDDAAIYIDDPFDHDTIAQEIFQIITDEKYMAELITKGKKRSLMFNWEHTANQTFSVYNEVLVEKRKGIK